MADIPTRIVLSWGIAGRFLALAFAYLRQDLLCGKILDCWRCELLPVRRRGID
ncbi:hypothetical protein ACFLVX_02615 [Chloroflexota bacterium]